MRRLTSDEALAAPVHRHSLGEAGTSVRAVAHGLVGLHNTSQSTPFLSVRARVQGFQRAELENLMWDSWELARFRTMRLAMFIFPLELLEIAAAATRHIAEPFAARWLRDSGLSQQEFDETAATVESALAAGPLTVRALRRELEVPQSVDLPGIVGRMCDTGRLIGGAPPRSWRSGIRCYHRRRDVLPDLDLDRWDEDAAIRELLHRYIRSYGPVTVNDMSWWTGISKRRCREALDAIGSEVTEATVDGWPGPLYWAPSRDTASEPEDGVRALPLLDPYVQGYCDRARFLDPARHDYVYDGGGNSAATLVRRGRIIGVWQVSEDPAPSVRFHLFDRCPASIRRAAEADLAAAGALYFDRPVDVVEVATMQPLSAGGGRSAAHPLDSRIHRASRRGRP